MNLDQKELVLFAGGSLLREDSFRPKALHQIDENRKIIEAFLGHLPKNIFSKIYILIEDNRLDEFEYISNWGLKNLKLEIQLVATKNGSTTEEKLIKFLSRKIDGRLVFSYPDIFADEVFWSPSEEILEDKVSITITPLVSRFPRVYSSPFANIVKGVSAYQAKVPANPHYIFAGRFESNVLYLRNKLDEYLKSESKTGNLEVGFFDWLAAQKSLIQTVYLDSWFIADGPRDYNSIINFLRDS
jgi:hypothetical protein